MRWNAGAVATPDESAAEGSARWRGLHRLITIDERSLALFRVGTALLILMDLAARAVDLGALYSDGGAFPRSLAASISPLHWRLFPLYFFDGSALWAGILLLLTAAIVLSLLVGYRTLTSTALTWYFVSCLHARTPTVNDPGDDLLRLLLLWGLLLPLGASGSIDDRLGRRSWSLGGATIGGAAVLVHLSVLLLLTPLGSAGRSGAPLSIGLPEALSREYLVTDWGARLSDLPTVVARADLSIAALLVAGAVLLWVPLGPALLRSFTLLFLVQLQLLGVAPAFHLGLQPWAASVAAVLLTPSWLWNQFTEASTEPGRVPRSESPRNRLQPLRLVAPAALLALGLATLPEHLTSDSRTSTSRSAIATLSFRLGIGSTPWMLPIDTEASGDWLSARGRLADGSLVDPLRGGQFSYRRPDRSSLLPGSRRWRRHLSSIGREPSLAQPFLGHLCSSWAVLSPSEPALEQIQLIMMLEQRGGGDEGPTSLPLPLAERRCSD